MDNNNSPKNTGKDILSLIDKYSNKPKQSEEKKETPAVTEQKTETPKETKTEKIEANQDEKTNTARHKSLDLKKHTESETVETVRETPRDGHFTDEQGNTVDDPIVGDDIEEMLNSEHFTDKNNASQKMYKSYQRAVKRNGEKRNHGSVTISIVKGCLYTAVVLLLAFFTVFGFGSIWPGVIPMANDVFAFVKPDSEISVTVAEGMTTKEVATMLEEAGVIDEEKVFRFYVKYKYDENITLDPDNITDSVMDLMGAFCKTMFFGGEDKELTYLVGEHLLNPSMNYDQIISELTVTEYTRQEVTVTIPEGYRADQIIDLLVANGIGTKAGFEYAINEYPYKHEFVKILSEQGYPEGRLYRLEGYLYPDTYIFYNDASETEVINKLLNNFERRVWNEYYSTYKKVCDELGFSFDEMITFASIVQAEGLTATDFENVSQVFHNRFKSDNFDKMESCATIQYVLEINRIKNMENGIYEERHEVLTAEDLQYETPYNTYKYSGLPPAAICNPGLDAIEAALYPDMSDDIKDKFNLKTAYYFNSDLAGNLYYAATSYQHLENQEKANKVNQQILNGTYNEDDE